MIRKSGYRFSGKIMLKQKWPRRHRKMLATTVAVDRKRLPQSGIFLQP
jgi:hypothetical protein